MGKVYADVMLAKLARWLRFAGIKVYDVPLQEDSKLLQLVKRSKATLLTSDAELFARARKAGIKAFLVKESSIEDQVAYVANALRTRIDSGQALICPICNSLIKKVNKENVKGVVPSDAYERHRLFYRCRKCGKTYWHGTHWKRIRDRLRRSERIAKEEG
ncbi:MAG: Mut7-C RNAse domain-containing protein [Candidatus Micrarchaeales archaeon]